MSRHLPIAGAKHDLIGLFYVHLSSRHYKRIFTTGTLSFFLVTGLGLSSKVFGDDLVIGVKTEWARGVQDRMPSKKHDGSAPHAPLYFWMLFEGNEAALKHIRSNGDLPIRHKWSVVIAGEQESEQPDSVSLSIGNDQEQTLSALTGKLKNEGKFTWRTWSMKKNISKGLWKIEVVYEDDGTPVNCREHEDLHPCVYTIQVQ